jgi:lipoyl(octanoyl) transferase
MAYVLGLRRDGHPAGRAGPICQLGCRYRSPTQPIVDASGPKLMPPRLPPASIDWLATPDPVAYEVACAFMAARVEAIAAGTASEGVWLLEHPCLFTAGTSAKPDHLLQPGRLPVFRSGRGGQFTYHGPGQRVVYLMLDVQARFGDVRAYVAALEQWIIDALAELGVASERRAGRIGVWVKGAEPSQQFAKIAAIGVRLRRWVSSHGVSLNVAPDLSHFAGIVPCGLDEPVTSLARLGCEASLPDVDAALRLVFERRFGPVQPTLEAARLGDLVCFQDIPGRTASRIASEWTGTK